MLIYILISAHSDINGVGYDPCNLKLVGKIKIQYREKDIAYVKIRLQVLEALCKMNQLTFF